MMHFLLRLFGFPVTLILGDTLILDRWRWIRRQVPGASGGSRLLDVGCGSGAFTIGAALAGYRAHGITYCQKECETAARRAGFCHARTATFSRLDARELGTCAEYAGAFDVVLCAECIEHILDDNRLVRDLAACLKPGGRLLLTTPNLQNRPISAIDLGPCSTTEDGGHVRRGYSPERLSELCDMNGLSVEKIGYCGGWISQRLTQFFRFVRKCAGLRAAGVALLPLRVLPVIFDPVMTRLLRWPYYSICMVARKL